MNTNHIKAIMLLTALLLYAPLVEADTNDSINVTDADVIWENGITIPSADVTNSVGTPPQVFSKVFVSSEDVTWKRDIAIPSADVTNSTGAPPQTYRKIFVSSEDVIWRRNTTVQASDDVTDSSDAPPQVFMKIFVSNEDTSWKRGLGRFIITEVTIPSGYIAVNGTNSLPVQIKNIDTHGGLGAYEFTILYNTSVLNAVNVTGGDAPFDSPNYNITNGNILINQFISSAQGPKGTIEVANITFEAVGGIGNHSEIGIVINSLVDAGSGEEIPALALNSSATIGLCGDVNSDENLTIADAMFIAQFLVGQRDASEINVVNAASVAPPCGRITIADAMFIAQYLVGQRGQICDCAIEVI